MSIKSLDSRETSQVAQTGFLATMGNTGLYVFCFSSLMDEAGFYLGLTLMLIGFLCSIPRHRKALISSPLTWIAILTFVYIVASFVINTIPLFATTGENVPARKMGDLMAISGVFSIVIAWALSLSPHNIYRALLLFLLGYLTVVVASTEWSDLCSYLVNRPLFGLRDGFGIYTLTILIGMLIYAYGNLGPDTINRKSKWLLFLSIVLFPVILVMFFLAQMRGAWVAAAVVLPIVCIGLRYQRVQLSPVPELNMLARTIPLATLLILIPVLLWNYEFFGQRILEEWDTVPTYIAEGAKNLDVNSTSLRIWLWEHAIHHIQEKPWFGWGPGAARYLITKSETIGWLGTYHNLYLHIWVELGLVGLALFAAWLYSICVGFFSAYKSQQLNFSLFLLIASLILAFAIVSFVQYRHGESGQFYMMFVGAVAASFQLRLHASRAHSDPAR